MVYYKCNKGKGIAKAIQGDIMKKLIPVATLENGETIQGCESTMLNIQDNVYALKCIFAGCTLKIEIIEKK